MWVWGDGSVIRRPVHKHEDLNLDPYHPVIRISQADACNTGAGGQGQGQGQRQLAPWCSPAMEPSRISKIQVQGETLIRYRASRTVQRIQVLQPNDRSPGPEAHIQVDGECQLHKRVVQYPHIQHDKHGHIGTHHVKTT